MLFTAVAAVGVIVVSCQKETAPGELLDLDMESIVQFTQAQQSIYEKATKRMDEHISFDANSGQYVMDAGLNASKIGLSQRFFNHFKKNFETSNSQLRQNQEAGYVAIEVSKNCIRIIESDETLDVLTRTYFDPDLLPEKFNGKSQEVEQTWNGHNVYMSQADLIKFGVLMGIGAYYSSWIPQPIVSKVVQAVLYSAAGTCEVIAADNPNGVVFKIPQFGAPMYVPQ